MHLHRRTRCGWDSRAPPIRSRCGSCAARSAGFFWESREESWVKYEGRMQNDELADNPHHFFKSLMCCRSWSTVKGGSARWIIAWQFGQTGIKSLIGSISYSLPIFPIETTWWTWIKVLPNAESIKYNFSSFLNCISWFDKKWINPGRQVTPLNIELFGINWDFFHCTTEDIAENKYRKCSRIKTIQINNLAGETIMFIAINNISAQIDLSTLPSGTYVITTNCTNGLVLKSKFIKR